MKVPPSIVSTQKLQMYDVVNPAGEDLWQVQTLMIDMANGRIAFVVVAFGGTLGLTDKWFALPWEILGWSPADKKFILNMPREVLEKAPGLNKKKWPAEVDLSWLAKCYEYYGCTPYWEENPEESTRKLAYTIWEQEDRPEGKHLEHYYRAEQILAETKKPKPKAKSAKRK
jgi:hypothetical protein